MADNSSDKAAEFATIQSINLARLEAGEVKAVIALLEGLSGDLVGVLEKNKGSIEKQQKIATVKAAADKTIAAHYAEIAKKNQETLEGVAANQSKAAAEQVNAAIGGGAFGGVKVFDPVLDAQQWNQLAKKTKVFGHSSRHWWEGQKVDLQDKFIAQIRQGYALGEDVETLSRRIRGTKANSYKDGVMNVKKHEAAALVRSSVQTISNEARMASFTKMKPAVKGIEWTATLDSRTTPVCRALDGKQWTLDKKPVGHDKNFPGATAHWNCRSTQIPVLASWQELSGKKIPAIGTATLQAKVNEKLAAKGWSKEKIAKATVRARASQDGQVSSNKDFDKWLMGKPKEFQRKLLGPTRAELWWKNDLTMADLVDQSGRPLTIQQLEEAIASGELPAETEGTKFDPLPPGAVEPYTDPDKAVKLQTRAVAKLEEIINNPAGQTVLAGYVKKVMTENPDLSPAEQLAKAEALTAEKKLQSQKTSALAKAKKKILDGKEPTPGQQKFIDGLSYEEKQAFWEAIDDAKKASSGQLFKDALAAIDDEGIVQGSEAFKKSLFETLDSDQTMQLVQAMESIKKEFFEQTKNDLSGQIDGLSFISDDPFEAAMTAKANKAKFDKLPPEIQQELKLQSWQLQTKKLKGDLETILKDEVDPLGTLMQNSKSKAAFDNLPPDLQQQVTTTAQVIKFENEAKEDLIKLQKDPFGKEAVEQVKKTLGDDASPSDIFGQAEELKAGLLVKDMAEQALTAKNKSAMSKALEDMLPGLKVKDYKDATSLQSAIYQYATDLQDLDDIENLHGAQAQIAKQIQETKTKSSALAKAKKKLANGEKPTPGQQKYIDELDPAEKKAFDEQVEEAAYKVAVEKAKPPGAPADWFDQFLAAGQETAGTPGTPKLTPKPAAEPIAPPVGESGPSGLQVSNVASLEKIMDLSGSTRPYLAKDPVTGKKYVVKTTDRGLDVQHLKNEAITDAVYRAAGARVPASTVITEGGKTYKVAEFIEGGDTLSNWKSGKSPADVQKIFQEAQQNFVADALFANWDAAGASFDNMFVAGGKLYRIDNGGGLGWRAQGGEKSSFFANSGEITELKTLRDPSKAPIMSQIMKGISQAEIEEQSMNLLSRRESIMLAAADLPKRDRDALERRFDWLEKQLPKREKPTPEKKAQIRRAIEGIPDDIEPIVKQYRINGASVQIGTTDIEDTQALVWREIDLNGNPVTVMQTKVTSEGARKINRKMKPEFDKAEAAKTVAAAPVPGLHPKDSFTAPLISTAKTLFTHADDNQPNSGTIAAFMDKGKQLAEMAKSGTPEEKDLAAHYLPFWEKLKDTVDNLESKTKAEIGAAFPPGSISQWYFNPSKYKKKEEAPQPKTTRKVEKIQTFQARANNFDRANAKNEPGVAMQFDLERGGYKIKTDDGVEISFADRGDTVTTQGGLALQGTTVVRVPGEPSAANVQRAIEELGSLGADVTPPSKSYKEYLAARRTAALHLDTDSAKWKAVEQIKDEDERSKAAKKFLKDQYGADFPQEGSQHYRDAVDGRTNGDGSGWRKFSRVDGYTPETFKDLVLIHNSTKGLESAVKGMLESGREATSTMGRVQKGVNVGATGGQSSGTDTSYGSSSYLFTRLRPANTKERGQLVFKSKNLMRVDTISYPGDYWGKLSRLNERASSLEDYKKFSKNGANETLFKNGLDLMTDLERINAATPQEKTNLIKIFHDAGITELADGRKIVDIIQY